jgi:hypothetical protein
MQENEVSVKGKRQRLLADVILILVILAIGLSVFLIVNLTKSEGEFVSVRVGDGEEQVYPLSVDGEYILNGGTNKLIISGGEAYMVEANCPDRTCVRTGKISKTGEKIVCLPNKIYISVLGAEEVLR